MGSEEIRTALAKRLGERRPEIEQAILTRVFAMSDAAEISDLEYTEGLRVAAMVAIDYGIAALGHSESRSPPIPTTLLSQARLAARNGVSLDTVLRRYFAGYTLLGDFVIEEAERKGVSGRVSLKPLLRAQAALFDRLIAAVTDEYNRETESRLITPERRRAVQVQRLLAGELIDSAEFDYDFTAHHLGAIAVGPGASEAMRSLATSLNRRALLVPRAKGAVWVWFGSRRRTDPAEVERLAPAAMPAQVSLAIGESAEGFTGWQLTHRQASAALLVAMRSARSFTRYGDVALLASMLQDDLLISSLHQLYLVPLDAERDGGKALRETLRAYFETERNVSSAAAALGVSRQTVINRLRVIERCLERPLSDCVAEVEAALHMEDLVPPLQTVNRVSESD